jgi:hypothetical protein
LPRLIGALGLAVAAFDLCFWKVPAFGLSVPVFFLALAGVTLAVRGKETWKRSTHWTLALLAGATVAAIFETGCSNTLVFLILILMLAGDTYFVGIDSAWGRGLSQLVALIRAPGRPFWLARQLLQANLRGAFGRAGGIILALVLTLPALVLVLIFGSLLATGNAVFGSWTKSFFHWIWLALEQVLDPFRIFLWGLIAFLVLPLLRPVQVSTWWWSWAQRLPRLPEIVPAPGAFFSSALVLLTLNGLFLVANVADALFLWRGDALPAGITYSSYVHHGVQTLTITVLLSAGVLVTLFQQAIRVTSRRFLRWLAFAWIAQNLFLLVSVALRLKLYIETYGMSVERLGVILFLVLVATGYVLLTIKIIQDRSLSWLIGACLIAAFATFYVTQFLDLSGWTADYNVARWQQDPSRKLDVGYLEVLGAPAWPALRRAHDAAPLDNLITSTWKTAAGDVPRGTAYFTFSSWREFSLRAWWNRKAIE